MRNIRSTSCVAVVVIFNTLPCSGITSDVQLEGGFLFFNPFPMWRSYKGFTDGYSNINKVIMISKN